MRKPHRLRLLSVRRLSAVAPHSAFTDLAFFRGRCFVTFREADSHALCEGRIRVLVSDHPCGEWRSAALLSEDGWDLRDPHFSVTAGGELELVIGGTRLEAGHYTGRQPRVCRSPDGETWGPLVPVCREGDWLWRVERAAGSGSSWGVSYRLPEKRRWTVHLMESSDGLSYREVADLKLTGLPNEATVRVLPDGTMAALVRRERGRASAMIGRARAPYTEWRWKTAGLRVGGPNCIRLSDGSLLAGFRVIRDGRASCVLADMGTRRLKPLLSLPSGGDCSYPGLAEWGGRIYVSYYSSHEGTASIYLATLIRKIRQR